MTFWRVELVMLIAMTMWCSSDIARGAGPNEDVDVGDTGDKSCHMTSQSLYSYVVKIWNLDWGNTSAHGSILSYRSILTTCAQFVGLDASKNTIKLPFNRLEVYGHKMRNSSDPDWSTDGENICFQKRKVVNVFPHPKCVLGENMDMFFNFAILALDKPFLVLRQHSYPSLQIPNTIAVALYYVVYANIVTKTGCELPIFYHHDWQKPTFDHNMKVYSMKWVTECIPRICEFNPFHHNPHVFRYPGQWSGLYPGNADWQLSERNRTVKACLEFASGLMNFTNLCVYFPNNPSIKIGHAYMDIRSHLWTGGAPLVCNGTAIGHTAMAKDRTSMHSFRHDFYLVNTYVRVWAWLVEKRPKFGQYWLDDHLLEKEMRSRGAEARESGPKPPIDPNLARGWPADYYNGNFDGSMNRSTRNQRSTFVSFILATISVMVIKCLPTFSDLYSRI